MSDVSGRVELALEITEVLREKAKQVRPLQRVEISRDAILREVRGRTSPGEGELEIAFESMEGGFRGGVAVGPCKVYFNPVMEVFAFEGVGTGEDIERAAEAANDSTVHLLRVRFESQSGLNFQRTVSEILRSLPYVKKLKVGPPSDDGGTDFDATYFAQDIGELAVVGQVKRTSHATTPDEMRSFVGAIALRAPRPNLGVFVSLGGYSPGAQSAAKSSSEKTGIKIQTHDLDDVLKWMKAYGVGIKHRTIDVQEVDPTFWDEIGATSHD